MATAGSGDVLTGMVAGLLAQRSVPALGAVLASVYLHGLAGDLAAAASGQRSMIASNIRDLIGDAITMVAGEVEK
jgi:NAD(P)H-hydrate epimerase